MKALKTGVSLRYVCTAAIGFSLLCAVGPGHGQELAPATAIAVRKDGYREMGTAFKSLNDELKKPTPMAISLKRSAATISKTAVRVPNWFPVGSGPALGIKTAAKPEIWAKRAEFDAIQRRLVVDAAQLDKLVAAGDMKAVAAQARVVGGDCKACHDKFRVRED